MAFASEVEDGARSVDVVVIGAGISGLCSAYDILKTRKDCRIVILEAKDRVGGRLDSTQLKTATGTDSWDLGGQWVGRTQIDILELMEELGLETYDQWFVGEKTVHLSDGAIKRYAGSYPNVSYFSLLDLYWSNSKIESLCKQVPLDDPRKCPHAEEWDGKTVESWIKQNAWTTACQEMFDIAVGAIFGVTPGQMSLLFFLHYINSSGGWSVLIESGMKGGAQEFKIKGGAHNVTKLLAQKIGWDKIHLQQPVTSIRQDDDKVLVKTYSGKSYSAKFVILSIPPHLTNRIEFSPPLPYFKRRFLENIIPSQLTKFVASYSTAFWRMKGLSGEICHTSDRHCCDMDPIGLTMDGTTSDGSPAILGFITSYAAAKWTDKSEENKKIAITQALAKYLGPEAAEPLDFVVKDWSKEKWNGGCPVDVMVPGAIMNYGDCLREPFQRVHWGATESSQVWRGYISGGVHAGHRAAKEVMERLDE